jgi:hypothetical protein
MARTRPISRRELLALGVTITLAAAGLIIFLVFFAAQLYPGILLATIIFFQLSFIWTCAEFMDAPDELLPSEDNTDAL